VLQFYRHYFTYFEKKGQKVLQQKREQHTRPYLDGKEESRHQQGHRSNWRPIGQHVEHHGIVQKTSEFTLVRGDRELQNKQEWFK